MIEAIEILRNLAGVMFWALADLVLGVLWSGIILGVLRSIVKWIRHD